MRAGDSDSLRIRRVDPRAIEWEDNDPVYRVYFWADDSSSDEYELIGASNVDDVIVWADEHSGGRMYTAYVVAQGGRGLVRVRGTSPSRA